jgi:hypothetical protein
MFGAHSAWSSPHSCVARRGAGARQKIFVGNARSFIIVVRMLALLVRVHRCSSVVDFLRLRPQAAPSPFVVSTAVFGISGCRFQACPPLPLENHARHRGHRRTWRGRGRLC